MSFSYTSILSFDSKTNRSFTRVIGPHTGLLRLHTRKEQPTGLGSIIIWREMRWERKRRFNHFRKSYRAVRPGSGDQRMKFGPPTPLGHLRGDYAQRVAADCFRVTNLGIQSRISCIVVLFWLAVARGLPTLQLKEVLQKHPSDAPVP